MSLDFYLESKITIINWNTQSWITEKQDVFGINITHNLNKMWEKAGCYNALYLSENKCASEIISSLKSAFLTMKENPQFYTLLESDNKWGTYQTALNSLNEIIEACELNLHSLIKISK